MCYEPCALMKDMEKQQTGTGITAQWHEFPQKFETNACKGSVILYWRKMSNLI